MRAFAVVSVMLFHSQFPLTRGGKTGVLVFFVLSGYLITTILLRERSSTGAVGLRRFYWNRLVRLAPALLLTVAGTALYAVYRLPDETAVATLQTIPSVLLYVNNWQQVAFGAPSTGWFGHFWSLAVEEQFYLLWPLLLLVAFRWKGARAVGWVALAGAALAVASKVLLLDSTLGRAAGTDFAADGLLIGCALAAFLSLKPPALLRWLPRLFWPGVAVLVAALYFGRSSTSSSIAAYDLFNKMWWPLAVVASAFVIGALVVTNGRTFAGKLLAWSPLVYLGRISYGMYLWHILFIAVLADGHLNLHGPALWAGLMILTVSVASLSYRYVEQPLMRRYHRYAPRVPDPQPARAA